MLDFPLRFASLVVATAISEFTNVLERRSEVGSRETNLSKIDISFPPLIRGFTLKGGVIDKIENSTSYGGDFLNLYFMKLEEKGLVAAFLIPGVASKRG